MPQEYDLTIRYRAEDLYVESRLTAEETAARTGASVSTIKRWAVEGKWSEMRRERMETRRTIKANLVKIRGKLAQRAADNPESKDIYALARLEELAQGDRKKESTEPSPAPVVNPRSIRTPGEAVDALQEVIEKKLNMLLAVPDTVSLKGIQELEKALGMIAKMREKYAPGKTGKKTQLAPETLDAIREQVYGL